MGRYLLLLVYTIQVLGCASTPRPVKPVSRPLIKFYTGSYDNVWNATLKVLDARQYKYPVANKDAGYIETDFKKGTSKTKFYFSGGQKFPKEHKWKMKLWILKSGPHAEETEDQIRLKIQKESYLAGGFLENWKRAQTDYIEEEVILYRISRVLDLDKLIDKLTTPQ